MTIDVLRTQLGFSHYTVNANCEGVGHDESLESSAGASPFNWVLGHIVGARHGMRRILGLEGATWSDDEKAIYARGSSLDASRALPLGRLLADFNTAQEQILERLGKLTADELGAPCPDVLSGEDSTVGVQLGTLVFHECYHAGQLGVLRRGLSKAGAIR